MVKDKKPISYAQLRTFAKTGGVLGVKGKGLVSNVIKFFTREEYSHVAMLVWIENGLWVFEFVEGIGYQCMPASQWFELREGQTIFYGPPPKIVTENGQALVDRALSFRGSKFRRHYGYFSTVRIFFAQFLNTNNKTIFKVCSTFIQDCWTHAGYTFNQTADPGDIMRHAEISGPLIQVTL